MEGQMGAKKTSGVSVAKRSEHETEGQIEAKKAEWNKCPGCGATICSMNAYCSNCGESLTVKCPQCASSWRFWKAQKFCPTCGTTVEKRVNISIK
jgi:predicted amidophosphoribosyltransferase